MKKTSFFSYARETQTYKATQLIQTYNQVNSYERGANLYVHFLPFVYICNAFRDPVIRRGGLGFL